MTTNNSTTPRLRKFIRQPAEHARRYGQFVLTARDFDVLETIFRYRHCTSNHIHALIAGSNQNLSRRLRAMFHCGYVARYVPRNRMRFELNAGSPVMAYGLDTHGWKALQESGRVTAESEKEWRKEYTRRTEWFLEHQLGIADLRCALEIALGDSDQAHGLREWDQSLGIRGEVTLTDRTVLRVNPDAYFSVVDADGHLRHFYVEYDRGTEEQRRIEAKFRSYWWWLQSPAYRDEYECYQRVAVLFVTTGERRMRNMMRTLAQMEKPNRPEYGGRGWFRFAVEDDYSFRSPESVLGPIWRTVPHGRETRLL